MAVTAVVVVVVPLVMGDNGPLATWPSLVGEFVGGLEEIGDGDGCICGYRS